MSLTAKQTTYKSLPSMDDVALHLRRNDEDVPQVSVSKFNREKSFESTPQDKSLQRHSVAANHTLLRLPSRLETVKKPLPRFTTVDGLLHMSPDSL